MLHHDYVSMQISPNKLDGTNYFSWSQFVKLYITGKGKMGYLTGKTPEPAAADSNFTTWVFENAKIMSWLLNSMTQDISASYLRLPTTHDDLGCGEKDVMLETMVLKFMN